MLWGLGYQGRELRVGYKGREFRVGSQGREFRECRDLGCRVLGTKIEI